MLLRSACPRGSDGGARTKNIHETEGKKNSKITSTNTLVGSLAKLGDLSRIGKTERADYKSHG